MGKTITVKDFLVELDRHLKERNLKATKAMLSGLSESDIERADIKKRLATYYFYNGELKQAITNFEQLIKQEPESADNYVNLMKMYQESRQIEKAYQLSRVLANRFKNKKNVGLEVAKLLLVQNKLNQLYIHLSNQLHIHKGDIDFMIMRGDCQSLDKKINGSRVDFEKSLEIARLSRPELITPILTSLAHVYYKSSQNDHIKQVLSELQYREDRSFTQNKAIIDLYEKTNELEKAKKIIDECEEKYPGNIEIQIYKLIYNRRTGKSDKVKALLENIKIESNIPSPSLKLLYKENAKYNEKIKNYPLAYDFYSKMNQVTIDDKGGSITVYKDIQERLTTLGQWDDLLAPLALKYNEKTPYQDDVKPIFFVGFPRSGTTLIDQILSTHPDITVIEEKPLLTNIIDRFEKKYGSYPNIKIAKITNSDKELMREHYRKLEDYFSQVAKGKVIVNKLPLNIVHIPYILEIFPNAKIIVALRHPMDSCLSCFFQIFSYNSAMANYLTMEYATTFYSKVMSHYLNVRAAYNANFHEVRYEDLVDDLEKEARELLEYLEVDWDVNVLKFYETAKKRTIINTPSYAQVTQPIYTTSTAKWKNYEENLLEYIPKLERFIQAFGYEQG